MISALLPLGIAVIREKMIKLYLSYNLGVTCPIAVMGFICFGMQLSI